jgi:hypothetical protein
VLKQHSVFDVWLLFIIVKGVQQWLAGLEDVSDEFLNCTYLKNNRIFLKATKYQILGCIVLEA